VNLIAGSIAFMVKGLRSALQSTKKRYEGFTQVELAECLSRMAVNDQNKKKVINGALFYDSHCISFKPD
jgi:hypothetical protein